MQWEHLTSADFASAVRDTGVCVIAMGVVEKHSDHLPLGTDFLNGHKIACLASEKEPSVVFPPFYFGQIYEARCFPGTVTIKPTLLVDLIERDVRRAGFMVPPLGREAVLRLQLHGHVAREAQEVAGDMRNVAPRPRM